MMFKTYPGSKIKRIFEKELEELNTEHEILQVEHIPEAIRENYACLVEYIPRNEYKTETDYKKLEKDYNALLSHHNKLCNAIYTSLVYDEDGNPTAAIADEAKLNEAIDLAADFFG